MRGLARVVILCIPLRICGWRVDIRSDAWGYAKENGTRMGQALTKHLQSAMRKVLQ